MLRRNAKCFPLETRNLLYKTNIRPILEYACTIWDPWTATDIKKLERVQNLAARFVVQNYTRYFSASQTKETLGWNTLQNRRKTFRLKFLHNIYHSKTGLNRDSYIRPPEYTSGRRDHPLKIKEYRCRTELFKMSFFLRRSVSGTGCPAMLYRYLQMMPLLQPYDLQFFFLCTLCLRQQNRFVSLRTCTVMLCFFVSSFCCDGDLP